MSTRENIPKMSLPEFIKVKKEQVTEMAIRLDTLGKTQKRERDVYFWLRDLFFQIKDVYSTFNALYDFMNVNDDQLTTVILEMLDLEDGSSTKDAYNKAKELGELMTVLMKRARIWMEEDKLREQGK